jgi:glycosyltransferase involved in cell wall biosynthesis
MHGDQQTLPAASPESLTAGVVVCTATWERAPLLRACVESLLEGERTPDELLVVVDTNPSLAHELSRTLPPHVRLLECSESGLSAARNLGIAAASADVLAFVDDDATADRRWLSSLMEAFAGDAALLGAGGPILPRWATSRAWMPDELLWVVGCTYSGHRTDAGPIRNPIGCNMAFRRRELVALGSFETSFGKRGRALATCDETELALRLERVHGPDRISYVPEARVHHLVPGRRLTWGFMVRRSLTEGLAKGRLQRLYRRPALGTERRYARLLVTDAIPRLLLDGIRHRDRDSALGAVAICASLAVSAAAYVAGCTRRTGESDPDALAGLVLADSHDRAI